MRPKSEVGQTNALVGTWMNLIGGTYHETVSQEFDTDVSGPDTLQ